MKDFFVILVYLAIICFLVSVLRKILYQEVGEDCEKKLEGSSMETPVQGFVRKKIKDLPSLREASGGYPLGWDKASAYLLASLLNKGLISECSVLSCIDAALKKIGRKCFEQHRDHGTYPDDTFCPEAFAYAMSRGEFSVEEIESIRFNHEQTPDQFVVEFGIMDSTLRKDILQRLLPPAWWLE